MKIERTKYPYNLYSVIMGTRYKESVPKEDLQIIDKLVSTVESEKCLRVIDLRFKECKDYDEIAKEFQITNKKAKSYVEVAVCRLLLQKFRLESDLI